VTVLFLSVCQEIEVKYTLSYLFTQFAFFSGTIIILKQKKVLQIQSIVLLKEKDIGLLVIFLIVVDVIAQLLSYRLIGIPIFLKSRLQTAGGGTGIFPRIISVYRCFGIFFVFYKYFFLKQKRALVFYLFYLLGVGILSGSRSVFLSYISSFYAFLLITSPQKRMKFEKKIWQLIPIIILLTIFLFLINKKRASNISIAAIDTFRRILFNGDVYFLAYPAGVIEEITPKGFINFFLGNLLRFFRLVDENFPQHPIGFDFSNIIYNRSGSLTGPNPRHNIIGYINFGYYGSIIFSFFCGLVFGMIRKKAASSNGLTEQSLSFLFYSLCLFVETDPTMLLSNITSILIFVPIIYVSIFFVNNVKNRI
jgi:hypothetical protein